VPATADTIFQTGSVGKQFTAGGRVADYDAEQR
jgi:hypothetical protein